MVERVLGGWCLSIRRPFSKLIKKKTKTKKQEQTKNFGMDKEDRRGRRWGDRARWREGSTLNIFFRKNRTRSGKIHQSQRVQTYTLLGEDPMSLNFS